MSERPLSPWMFRVRMYSITSRRREEESSIVPRTARINGGYPTLRWGASNPNFVRTDSAIDATSVSAWALSASVPSRYSTPHCQCSEVPS